jgi:hypothetical protein
MSRSASFSVLFPVCSMSSACKEECSTCSTPFRAQAYTRAQHRTFLLHPRIDHGTRGTRGTKNVFNIVRRSMSSEDVEQTWNKLRHGGASGW